MTLLTLLQSPAGGAPPGTLALHASTPSMVFNNGGTAADCTVTTGNFTPPAGALLVACTMASSSGTGFEDPMVTITDNAGANVGAWTTVGRATTVTTSSVGISGGVASIHWAKVETSSSIAVTSSQNTSPPQEGSPPTYLKVYVITGADMTTPFGDTDMGYSTANTMVTGSMTSTRDVSWKIACATEWAATGTAGPNHPDLNIGTEVFDDTVDPLVGACGMKEVTTSGTAFTVTIDAAGTAVKEWLWIAGEIRRSPGGGGTDYVKDVPDTAGLTDSATATQDMVRAPADAAGLLDSATRTLDAVREPADPEGITDAVSIEQGRTVADTAGLLDSATRTMDMARSQADTAGLTDSATAQQDVARTVTDTAGITDSVTATLQTDKSAADVLGITDSASATQALDRSPSDTAGLLDVTTAQIDAVRSQADALGITDAVVAFIAKTADPADTAGITDLANQVQSMVRELGDTLGITDSVSAVLGTPNEHTVIDPLGITDAVWTEVIQVIDYADVAALTDSATTSLDRLRWPEDTSALTDTTTATQALDRALADSEALADEALRALDAQRPPADTAGATDAVTATMGMVRDADDFAGLSDAVSTIMERFQPPLVDTITLTDSVTAVMTRGTLEGYVLDGVPLATRWTISALDERWSYLADVGRFSMLGLVDRYETTALEARWAFGPIPGENMASVDILVSAGAAKYVGGTITEKTGKDISGATFQISLGSETSPGRTWLTPSISTAGDSNASRIVKYLVSVSTPSGLVVPGQYWAWVRVTDAPEIEPLRVQGPINVR